MERHTTRQGLTVGRGSETHMKIDHNNPSDGVCGNLEETPDPGWGQGRLPGGGASIQCLGERQKIEEGERGIYHSRRT